MATRGSDKLKQQIGARCTFEEADLEKVISVLRENDYKIIDWECKGQPRPDAFAGTVEVDGKRLGKATELISTKLGLRLGIEIFPYGIPIPDIYRIRFQSLGH